MIKFNRAFGLSNPSARPTQATTCDHTVVGHGGAGLPNTRSSTRDDKRTIVHVVGEPPAPECGCRSQSLLGITCQEPSQHLESVLGKNLLREQGRGAGCGAPPATAAPSAAALRRPAPGWASVTATPSCPARRARRISGRAGPSCPCPPLGTAVRTN